MQIWIVNRQKKYGINRRKVLQWAREILFVQNYRDAEVGLLFVNDRQIQVYNAKYRAKNKATNVLAFPMLEGIGADLHPQFLGDVMISLETARKEAVLFSRKPSEQLLILLIHGLLHLIGYDHERSEKEARRMQRREKLLFKRLSKSSKSS